MHYDYLKTLEALWQQFVDAYRAGKRDFDQWTNEEERNFLASIGMNSQELFDFAEDFVGGGEPDFATMATIQDIRRRYFLEVMKGEPGTACVTPADLTPKNADIEGVVWLPRIMEKARAKLRGEMDADLMYGCGGDRNFFRTNDIHPAEFLALVRDAKDDREIIDWVHARRASAGVGV